MAGCSPVRTFESASLLADIALVETQPVAREDVAYLGTGGPRHAYLYRPQTPRAALVIVPGAAERALEDPRLINFADALRRRGFVVLVPQLAGPDPLMVSAADADAVADAVRHLATTEPFQKVGLVALSYAVGPTILAALDDDIRNQVDFILAIGGYHDIVAGVTYITTGAFREAPGAPWRSAPVDAQAKWLFLRANAVRVDDPADVRLLQTIARRRLDDPQADTGPLTARLGPGGRAVYDLLVNRDPDRTPTLVAGLPLRLRTEILALDLARRDLSRLGADLILIHGTGDPMVPYTESVNLARAARPGSASLYLLGGLDHVNLGALGPTDVATLLRAAYRVLSEREPAPPLSGPDLAPTRAELSRRHNPETVRPQEGARRRCPQTRTDRRTPCGHFCLPPPRPFRFRPPRSQARRMPSRSRSTSGTPWAASSARRREDRRRLQRPDGRVPGRADLR